MSTRAAQLIPGQYRFLPEALSSADVAGGAQFEVMPEPSTYARGFPNFQSFLSRRRRDHGETALFVFRFFTRPLRALVSP